MFLKQDLYKCEAMSGRQDLYTHFYAKPARERERRGGVREGGHAASSKSSFSPNL